MRGPREDKPDDLPVWLDESVQISTDEATDLLEPDDGPFVRVIRSRVARIGAVMLLIAVGSAIGWRVVDHPHSKPAAAPRPSVASSSAIGLAPQRSTLPYRSRASGAIAQVLGQVHNSVTDYVRQTSPRGACRLATAGRPPTTRIKHALTEAFPELRRVRIGSTLDEYTALCAVSVQAIYREAVVTLSIRSPEPRQDQWRYARLETGILTAGAVTTEYALSISRTGWRVLVGASGPADALPPSNDLLKFAQERRLTW